MLAASSRSNCQLSGDGTGVNWKRSRARFGSCRERAEFLVERGVSFNAVEHRLDGDDSEPLCTDQLFYVTIVRDPIERIRSFARFHETNSSELVRWATDGRATDTPYFQVDNYYVRTLGGAGVFHLPLGAIGQAEFNKAQRVLAQFHKVLVLDELDAELPELLDELGWTAAPVVPAENPTSQANREKFVVTPEDTAVLRKLNRWDVMLWEAVRAQHRRTARHQDTRRPPR